MINLYDSKETNFEHNGLVVLSDCISCTVIEELNGMHEAKIEHPIDERGKWKYLLEGNIVKIDSQFFRIYHKQKKLTSIFINLRHIYYDLLDNFLEDITLTNLSGAGALDLILTNTQYAHSFTSLSDVSTLANKHFVRKNVVEAIMGTDGLINNIGGELVRDNFNIKLLGARGLDRGVLVAYGKNVQGIEETLDTDGICTRLMPVGKDGLLLTEKYIDSIYIDNFSHPKIKVVELSDYETEGTLRVAGQEYIADNKIDIPQFNYKIDFLELSKTEEYKDYAVLERVYLGDTVTIKHNRLDINLKAKVIKITKNILTDRIEKIELGSFKDNIATTINNSIQEVKQDIVQVKSDYQKAIEDTTALITGSTGGNLIIKRNAEGQPVEIDVMDTISELTCSNVWRWNLDGFAHSSSGFAGPFTVGITADGHILGELITALSISASQIKTDELVVGTNIAMGANAIITWANLNEESKINLKGETGIQGIPGLEGTDGIQGIPGADGVSSYTHIAYSTSATGSTGFSTSDPTNKTYIGMYVDSNLIDSENYSVYVWSLIKGADGEQGIQGPIGIDGLTPYFHIAYATDGVGGGFSTTISTGKTWIGQYTDNTSADNGSYTFYSWTLIKGDVGETGIQGIPGLDGSDATVPSYITSTKITATTIESPAISAGTIASSSISAGTITGASISAGTISGASIIGGSIIGASIRTSNSTSYLMMHDQYIDFYNAGTLMGSMGYKYNPNSGGYDTGLINPNCSFTTYGTGWGFDLRSTGMNYFWGDCDFRGAIKCDTGYIAKESWVSTNFVHDWELADYATQSWVSSNYASHSWVASNYTQFLYDTVYLPNGCYLECLTNRLILHANSTNYISVGSGTMIVVEDGASRPV